MFYSIAACTEKYHRGSMPVACAAMVADLTVGIALLTIGILAMQLGFLPSHLQYALIGAGAAYSFGILCGLGGFVINVLDRYLQNKKLAKLNN